MKTNRPLTELEKVAIEHALSGADESLAALRSQVSLLQVLDRVYTGAGFYTYFQITAPNHPKVERGAISNPIEINATHPDVPGGVAFLLWTSDGVIDFLEGAAGMTWPNDETKFSFPDKNNNRSVSTYETPLG